MSNNQNQVNVSEEGSILEAHKNKMRPLRIYLSAEEESAIIRFVWNLTFLSYRATMKTIHI